MKKMFLLLFAIIFTACQSPVIDVPEPTVIIADGPSEPTPDPVIDTDTGTLNDPRLSLVTAADAKWIRKPYSVTARGIASGDPVASLCVTPAWSYMFYDDGAVIGYEPFPDDNGIMAYAVALTVESHNMEYPDAQWDFINVPPIGPPPPVTDFDPVMGVWQVCLCIDDGTIVMGPYTAEFAFNWTAFKSTVQLEMESYNLDHPDNKAHIVWGTDKPAE